MSSRYSPPLQVVGYYGTPRGDPEGGPLVRLRPDDAARRLLAEGELAWVYGPRRNELARVAIDDSVPRGGVIVRDVAGLAVSEIVRIVKAELDRPTQRSNS